MSYLRTRADIALEVTLTRRLRRALHPFRRQRSGHGGGYGFWADWGVALRCQGHTDPLRLGPRFEESCNGSLARSGQRHHHWRHEGAVALKTQGVNDLCRPQQRDHRQRFQGDRGH